MCKTRLTQFILFVAAISMLVQQSAAETKTKVKVFILTGQSNMEGKGRALHLETYKTDPLIKDTYDTLEKGDGWAVRDDVWIAYPTKNGGAKSSGLTVGYGTKGEDSIGPEFGFGHTIGEAKGSLKVGW